MNSFINKYKIKNIEEYNTALTNLNNGSVVFFGISGKMASGKDTVGDSIADILRQNKHIVGKYSYASPLRKEIDDIVNLVDITPDTLVSLNITADNVKYLKETLDGDSVYDRTTNARKALQQWGTDIRRKQNVNHWVNKVAEYVIHELANNRSVYITDARFPNEVELIDDLGLGVIRLEVSDEIRIKRIKERDGLTPTLESINHSSEIILDDYKFSHVINGEENLETVLSNALSALKVDL